MSDGRRYWKNRGNRRGLLTREIFHILLTWEGKTVKIKKLKSDCVAFLQHFLPKMTPAVSSLRHTFVNRFVLSYWLFTFFKCQNSNDNLGIVWWWTKWSLGSKRMRRKVRMFYWTNGGGWLNGWVGEESGLRCPNKEKWATSWASRCRRLAYHYCTDDCEAMDSYPLSGQTFFFGCGVTLQGLKSGLSIKHHF